MPAPLKSTNKFQQHMQLPVADQPCPTWVKAMEGMLSEKVKDQIVAP